MRISFSTIRTKWAPILFAVALIAAGQSSTITGTLAGQIIMEGYLNLRIQPWVRRIITRLIAIPAVVVLASWGSDREIIDIKSGNFEFATGFAIIPLIHFVSDKSKMRGFHISRTTQVASWIVASIIVALNGKLVYDEITGWLEVRKSYCSMAYSGSISIKFLDITVYRFKPFVKKIKNRNSKPFST
jgi:manganese transport protein